MSLSPSDVRIRSAEMYWVWVAAGPAPGVVTLDTMVRSSAAARRGQGESQRQGGQPATRRNEVSRGILLPSPMTGTGVPVIIARR